MITINGSVERIRRPIPEYLFEVCERGFEQFQFEISKADIYRALFGGTVPITVVPVSMGPNSTPITGNLRFDVAAKDYITPAGYDLYSTIRFIITFPDVCVSITMVKFEFVNMMAFFSPQDAQIKDEDVDK